MSHVLIMPRQGNTVESCIIVRWKATEGQPVEADSVVCEVETDKASFDVPAGASGLLLKILRSEGDDVPVLEPIAVIGAAGEDWKAAVGATVAAGASAAAEAALSTAATPPASPRAPLPLSTEPSFSGERAVSPRARALAAAEGIAAAAIQGPHGIVGTGPGGRVIERDVAAAAAARPPLTAAAKAAVFAGATAPSIGSALGGRVGVADLKPASPRQTGTPGRATMAGEAPTDGYSEKPLKGVRKIISERMLGSLASTAQLTFNSSADASRLLDLRSRFKASDPALGLTEVTIGDLVNFAVSRTLARFPDANATLERGTLRLYERVHLALAVDTPRGLMVPVIRNADLLSLREISAEAKRLAAACQAGDVSPDELSGGTFTVSNLGAFGVESFTPVLNAPQVAILGVDAIVPRAAAGPGGSLVLERRIGLSLTVDHQIIDGVPAARLLKGFADAIADIDLLLLA